MDKVKIMEMFESFDFDNDDIFQVGWKVISKQVDASKKHLALIKAKVFYFNKNVARLDLEEYLAWLKTKTRQADLSSDEPEIPTVKKEISSSSESKQKEGKKDSHGFYEHKRLSGDTKVKPHAQQEHNGCCVQNIKIDIYPDLMPSDEHKANDVKFEEEVQLSFSQVTELILSNKVIPGLKTIDIKPTNSRPTPSTMIRKAKPWEVIEKS